MNLWVEKQQRPLHHLQNHQSPLRLALPGCPRPNPPQAWHCSDDATRQAQNKYAPVVQWLVPFPEAGHRFPSQKSMSRHGWPESGLDEQCMLLPLGTCGHCVPSCASQIYSLRKRPYLTPPLTAQPWIPLECTKRELDQRLRRKASPWIGTMASTCAFPWQGEKPWP